MKFNFTLYTKIKNAVTDAMMVSVFLMFSVAFGGCKFSQNASVKTNEQLPPAKYPAFIGLSQDAISAGRIQLAVFDKQNPIEDSFKVEMSLAGAKLDVSKTSPQNELKLSELKFSGIVTVGPDSDLSPTPEGNPKAEDCQISGVKLQEKMSTTADGQVITDKLPTIECLGRDPAKPAPKDSSHIDESLSAMMPADICKKYGGTELAGSCSCTGKPELPNQDVFIAFPSKDDKVALLSFAEELKSSCVTSRGI